MSVIWNNEAFKRIKILSLPEDKTIYGLFVEGGIKIPEVNVVYNDALSASLVGGDTATLPVASKKMKSDIKIAVPESAFSPLPIEVSTEAEMTALLTSGEVGGVYKYTGTTGTYENGALYVLEAVEPYSSRIDVYDSGVISTRIDLTTYEGQLWSVLHDVTLYAENGDPYTVTINAVNEVMLAGTVLDAVASDTISGVYAAYFTASGGSGN